ncbi:hypothetical protein AB4Y44_27910 [Paraburkholderia sp. BR10937]|uniref:hypothetical protein n=1 Tax=Paraburkholderia sp. BR10937 TaxID=3236994 RepID=UPI0034D284F9
MPGQQASPVVPAPARSPEYDIQVAVTAGFLNHAIALAFSTGVLPSKFHLKFGAAEDPLGLSTSVDVDLSVSDVALFTEAGEAQLVGLRAKWSGTITIHVSLADWTIKTPGGDYIEPGVDQSFTVPFEGDFAATAKVILKQLDDNCILTISFAQLDQLDLARIGSLTPGADFTEVIRATIERIAVVALRKRITLPTLNGLPGSLATPAQALLDAQSAQIGATDFKVTSRADAESPDELQLLLQATQNLGQQSYQAVVSVGESGSDVAIALSVRFLTQILQDLWVGGVIPTQFDDKGQPSRDGPNWIERLSFSATDSGKLQLRVFAQRKVIGLPITVNVTLEFKPVISSGGIFANDVTVDLDLDVGWARATAGSALFFFLYQCLASVLIRSVADVLEPWADAMLADFLNGKGISLKRSVSWDGTPFKFDFSPSFVNVSAPEISFGVALNLHA